MISSTVLCSICELYFSRIANVSLYSIALVPADSPPRDSAVHLHNYALEISFIKFIIKIAESQDTLCLIHDLCSGDSAGTK